VGVKRKQHSAEFKARVAMAALSGEPQSLGFDVPVEPDPWGLGEGRDRDNRATTASSEIGHQPRPSLSC
jgi:hypothetical protein